MITNQLLFCIVKTAKQVLEFRNHWHTICKALYLSILSLIRGTTLKKILIFGLPGSGKSTIGNKLSQKLDCIHLNADEVRERFNDWDFSEDGRLRQAYRMKQLAEETKSQYVILDFVCPKKEYRDIISPDISIFMNTIKKGRFKNTNVIFEEPENDELIDYIFKTFDSDQHVQNILKNLITFDWRKPTVQMLGDGNLFMMAM